MAGHESEHTLQQKISLRIRQLRIQKKYTQEKLSEHSLVDYKHIQLLEGSRSINVRIATLEKICQALDISLSDFFAGIENGNYLLAPQAYESEAAEKPEKYAAGIKRESGKQSDRPNLRN